MRTLVLVGLRMPHVRLGWRGPAGEHIVGGWGGAVGRATRPHRIGSAPRMHIPPAHCIHSTQPGPLSTCRIHLSTLFQRPLPLLPPSQTGLVVTGTSNFQAAGLFGALYPYEYRPWSNKILWDTSGCCSDQDGFWAVIKALFGYTGEVPEGAGWCSSECPGLAQEPLVLAACVLQQKLCWHVFAASPRRAMPRAPALQSSRPAGQTHTPLPLPPAIPPPLQTSPPTCSCCTTASTGLWWWR